MTCDAHFRTRLTYSSQESCVKIWFGLVEIGGMLIFRVGEEAPYYGWLHVTCNAHFRTQPSYSSQKSCVKIWFGLVEPFKSYRGNIKKKKNNPQLGGVTFGLWCPCSNSSDQFQSKVMCENLVWIGWNRRYVNFQGVGKSPLLEGATLTCDVNFGTWLSYSSQKSCVKIWFRLVEPFKSYRVTSEKKHRRNWKKAICFLWAHNKTKSQMQLKTISFEKFFLCGEWKQVKPLGFDPPGKGLTIIERSWNSGSLPYLVANAYGSSFIKIGGIWIFRWGGGGRQKSPLGGVTFDLQCPFSNSDELFQSKIHMWKFGLDWLKSEVC